MWIPHDAAECGIENFEFIVSERVQVNPDDYYISKLVRRLWLVNLAGRTLLHGPLKFKVLFAAKLLRDKISSA